MKKQIAVILSLFSFVLSLKVNCFGANLIEWNITSFKFENIKRNQSLKIRFLYTNKSDKDIYLKSIQYSHKDSVRLKYELLIDHNRNVVSEGGLGFIDVTLTAKDSPVCIQDTIYAIFNDNVRQSLAFSGTMNIDVKQPLPMLTFYDTFYNFGIINDSNSVFHTFKFINTGDAYLSISKAYGTCGCVQVSSFTKDAIAPGETGVVKVIVYPKSATEASLKKYIYVQSNGGNRILKVVGIISFKKNVKNR